MSPRVTVLMAVRDGEPFVGEAVRSVLDQTFTDFELLVVDDASADATVPIIEGFDDPRIRVLRNEQNLGQVPSLNRGLREARGAYIARLDADDACRPTRLERQIEILDSSPQVGLVGTWIDAVDARGRRLGRLRQVIEHYVDFVYYTLVMQVYISHPSAMYRRDQVRALGGYDESTGPAEDKDLWRKLALHRHEARIVPETLVLYRIHDEQLSRTRAEHQRHMDVMSQDRFLAELAPDASVSVVRQLLAGDPDLWRQDVSSALRGVEDVVSGARVRLKLDDEEVQQLRERVARRLLDVAGMRPWSADAQAVAAAALAGLPAGQRGAARRRHAAALVRAPVRTALRRGARLAGDRARALPVVSGVRQWARRSPLLRNLYSRAIGSR